MCIFCKIVDKEIPSYTIYEDEKVKAFLDVMPATKGHVLVIPKEHSSNFLEADDVGYLMEVAQRVAVKIDKVFSPKGMRIQTNIKEAAGQSVFHTHIHILPIYKDGDAVGNTMPLKDGELEEIYNELKKEIAI